MALDGLDSGRIQVFAGTTSKRQTLDFRMSFIAILLLCVKFDLAYWSNIRRYNKFNKNKYGIHRHLPAIH